MQSRCIWRLPTTHGMTQHAVKRKSGRVFSDLFYVTHRQLVYGWQKQHELGLANLAFNFWPIAAGIAPT